MLLKAAFKNVTLENRKEEAVHVSWSHYHVFTPAMNAYEAFLMAPDYKTKSYSSCKLS